jgi:hypothetical protein
MIVQGLRSKVIVAALVLLAAPAARAQGAPPQAGEICWPAPPAQTHDGFYAHLQLGGGYPTARSPTTHVSGGAVALSLAVGGVVLPNLALFAGLVFHVAIDPDIQVNGVAKPISGSSLENDSFGAGAAYYLEPANVYLSAALTGTSVQLYDGSDDQVAASNIGLGFQAMVGKEWWVGREWGLGAAAEVTGAWAFDATTAGQRWSAFSYSLALSATYN